MPLNIIRQPRTLLNSKAFKITSVIIIILFMANLNALVDYFHHPEIPYFDDEHIIVGSVVGFFCLLLLVTTAIYFQKLNKLSDILNESERQFKTLFENNPNAIFITDPDSLKILNCNENACLMNGYSRNELIGQSINILHTHEISMMLEDSALRSEEIEKLKQHRVITVESTHRRKDGTLFPIESSISLITLGGREVVMGIDHDITGRKLAKEKLEKSEIKYRALFEGAGDYLFLIQLNEQKIPIIIDANNAAAEQHGYTREELIGMPVLELEPPRARALFEKRRHLFENGIGTVIFETEHVRKDGSIFPVEVSVRMLQIGDEPPYSLSIERDITQRKKIENALRENEVSLRELAANLQTIREEERGRIAREIHDVLGQSLTGIKLETSFLVQNIIGVLPTASSLKVTKKFDSIMMLIDSMIVSIREICADLRPVVLDRLGLVAALEWQTEEFQRKTGIRCEYNLHPQKDLDTKKEIALFRIFQESLTNVVRHAKASHVSVTYATQDSHNILIIHDNGVGITSEQLDDRKSLGLLGIKERAISFGGGVVIQGIKGEGTTVTVKIPLTED